MNKFANYFDYAAATPMLSEAKKAMEPFLIDKFYNPSALYLASKNNRQALQDARQVIASDLGVKPLEVIFTAGGTEANNLAIQGVLKNYPKGHVVTCDIEHKSVLKPVELFDHSIVAVDNRGFINLKELKKSINNNTVLITIGYANNEIGTIQPIKEISKIVKEIKEARRAKGIKTPIYLHSDACQAVNYLDLKITRLGVDLLTVNAGKIYGPKQCGALYVKTGCNLKPLILGGNQEHSMRSGTENLANVAGFAKAWQIVRQDFKLETRRVANLRDRLIKLINQQIPQATINGPFNDKRLANNISVTIPGFDNEILVMKLDEAGFQTATGSACSASGGEPSYVLKAIGLSNPKANSTLRITLGKYSTSKSIKLLAEALKKATNK
jgi:cysteine desulfurase